MSDKLRRILGSLLVLIAVSAIGIVFFRNNFANYYSEWLTATPSISKPATKTVTTKKKTYDVNFTPPKTSTEKNNALISQNLNGTKYLGTIMTEDKHLNVNIYGVNDLASESDKVLNTGHAVAYPGFNPDKGNSTSAAHTYSIYGWNYYEGYTMIQQELDKGDKVYFSDGKNFYRYEVQGKEIVSENAGEIVDVNRNKDKKINPSGGPMMTLYDCYEPVNGPYLQNPDKRNVVYLSRKNKYTAKTAPNSIKKIFNNKPKYVYDKKTKKLKLKDVDRKGNFKLQIYDLMFKTLKLQNLM